MTNRKWLKYKIGQFLIGLLAFAINITNYIYIDNIMHKRVEKILSTQNFIETYATVIKIDVRHSYSRVGKSSKRYDIINYISNNRLTKQAILDNNRIFHIGNKLRIKYSEKYPEMFAVIDTALKTNYLLR